MLRKDNSDNNGDYECEDKSFESTNPLSIILDDCYLHNNNNACMISRKSSIRKSST